MRLLLLNYEFPPLGGGGGRVTERLAREYARRGHQVDVLTSAYHDLPSDEERDGYRIVRVRAMRRSTNVAQVHEMLSYCVSSSIAAAKHHRDAPYDAVHAFFGIPSGVGAYWLRRRTGLPYVVFLGGRDVPRPNPEPPYYRYLYVLLKPAIRAIWREASHVVACSDGLRDLARATDPTASVAVIPDGVDLEAFTPKEHRSEGPARILGIGRLIPRKGFDALIRATAALEQRGRTGFEVEIVGDGPERQSLERLAETLGVGHRVRFAGTVSYADLPARYAAADIYALTSHAEGMPLVVLEAMATGLPIVATDVQGMQELVEDGSNGYRFAVGDHEALAQRLEELIANPASRAAFGVASRQRVERYSWSSIADSYLELLQDAARGGGRR